MRIFEQMRKEPIFASAVDDIERPWQEQRAVTMARMNKLLQYRAKDSEEEWRARVDIATSLDEATGTGTELEYCFQTYHLQLVFCGDQVHVCMLTMLSLLRQFAMARQRISSTDSCR
jgi:hypothetical protein